MFWGEPRLTQNHPSTLFEVRAEQLCGGGEMTTREEAMSQLDPTARVFARWKRAEKILGRKQNPFLTSESHRTHGKCEWFGVNKTQRR